MGKKHRRPEPTRPGNPYQQAIALHQAGRLADAEAIYRTLPQDANVLQLRGVLYFQTGRRAEGLASLHHAIELDPNHVDALANLAVAQHENGEFQEALSLIERAIIRDPRRPDLLDKRGFVLQDLGRHAEAATSFRLVLADNPNFADAWFHLGNSLRELSQLKEAAEAFRNTIRIRPQDADALNNLGSILFLQMKAQEARPVFERSIAIRPSAEAYRNLGACLSSFGEREAAIRAITTATQLEPKNPAHHEALGKLFTAYKMTPEALRCFRKAAELSPGDESAQVQVAATLGQEGRLREAQEVLDGLSHPSDAALLIRSILVPVIPMSTEEVIQNRTRVVHQLCELAAKEIRIAKPDRDVSLTSFLWSYHSESELDMQKAVVDVYRKASPELFWQSPYLEEKRSGKLKVGVLSSVLNKHTIGKLFRHLVGSLSDEDIEVVNFDCAIWSDDWTKELNSKVDSSYKLVPEVDFCRDFIAEQRLDALFYPEIGMNPFTYYMAFARLAPLQFMTWGHPVSTALPHMDCFLSSDDLETPGSEAHYSERLVKFPTLMTDFERPEPRPITRADLGLPEGKHLYTCPQTLFKLHPDLDRVFAEILRRDENGLIVLLTGNEKHWDDLIRQRFAKVMPDVADRVVILRRLSTDEYIGLCAVSDVTLDTWYFSGGNSSLEAFSVGAPIVTLPGTMLRGRITLSQYRSMEMDDLIARDEDHYVGLALRLGQDREFNHAMRAKIMERNDVLYGNKKPAQELKAWLRETIAR